MSFTCECGGVIDVAGERDGVGHCERCGRYAYFAIIGGRHRRISPWFGTVDPKGPSLPYNDR